jgi:hypothetical protein
MTAKMPSYSSLRRLLMALRTAFLMGCISIRSPQLSQQVHDLKSFPSRPVQFDGAYEAPPKH